MEFKPADMLTASLLIDAREFARLLSVPVKTLWGMVSADLAPAPLRLSRTCLRWRRTDAEAFIASLGSERPAVSAVPHEPSVVADNEHSAKSAPWDRHEWLAFHGMKG